MSDANVGARTVVIGCDRGARGWRAALEAMPSRGRREEGEGTFPGALLDAIEARGWKSVTLDELVGDGGAFVFGDLAGTHASSHLPSSRAALPEDQIEAGI